MCLVTVPLGHEAEHGVPQVLGAGEVSVLQDSALQQGEPDLDLVDPRRVNRRVDEVKAVAVAFVEPGPPLVLAVVVDIEVIPDDIDLSLGIGEREVPPVSGKLSP
jgi:hypothetical protein